MKSKSKQAMGMTQIFPTQSFFVTDDDSMTEEEEDKHRARARVTCGVCFLVYIWVSLLSCSFFHHHEDDRKEEEEEVRLKIHYTIYFK